MDASTIKSSVMEIPLVRTIFVKQRDYARQKNYKYCIIQMMAPYYSSIFAKKITEIEIVQL